jgi:hypothetical protein
MQIMFRNSIPVSQKERLAFATRTNLLPVLGGIMAVYCENHTKNVNTLCGQSAEFFVLKVSDAFGNHGAFKG